MGFLLIVSMSLPNAFADFKFDDVEEELRAINDSNYIEHLKAEKLRANKQSVARKEHTLLRKKTEQLYKNSIKEHVKLRSSRPKTDDSKLEELHNKQELLKIEQHKKLRKDFVLQRKNQQKNTEVKNKLIKANLKKNAHILNRDKPKLERVEKHKRKY